MGAMAQLSEEEAKARRAYRRVIFVALIVVASLTVWLVIPPKPLDLRFLSTLGLTKLKRDPYQATYRVDLSLADVENALDARLKQRDGWNKTTPYAPLPPSSLTTPAVRPGPRVVNYDYERGFYVNLSLTADGPKKTTLVVAGIDDRRVLSP